MGLLWFVSQQTLVKSVLVMAFIIKLNVYLFVSHSIIITSMPYNIKAIFIGSYTKMVEKMLNGNELPKIAISREYSNCTIR